MTRSVDERNTRWFPGFVPAHEVYLNLAAQSSRAGSEVLHLGAGRDALGVASRLPDRVLTSVDCDAKSLELNPNQRKVLADGARLPFPDASFDLALCEHVFEHLEHPLEVLCECARVLRPGGRLLFLTPNRWSYIALFAGLTPHRFHVWYRSAMTATADIDTFPTFYRLNSRRQLSKCGAASGFALTDFRTFVGCPTYLERGDWLHRFGVLLHWMLEKGPAALHISLVGALTKSTQNLR